MHSFIHYRTKAFPCPTHKTPTAAKCFCPNEPPHKTSLPIRTKRQRSSHVSTTLLQQPNSRPRTKVIRSLSGSRPQADAPNPGSSSHNTIMSLVWYGCTCQSLRVLRCASQFVTPLAVPAACVRAATVSCIATSFIPSFVPLHYTTCVPSICRKAWHTAATRKAQARRCTRLCKASPAILTGFHSATLRPSFTSVACSPPAAYVLLAFLACHACGFVTAFVPATQSPRTHNKSTRQTLA